MSDKVQLIREEIERLQRNLNECISPNNPILPGTLNVTFNRLKDFIDSLPEEPASEDLEEEIDRFEEWLNSYNQSDYPTSYTVRDIARHFAEWQREKDIKLEKIDDLEEFAQKWAYSNYHKELDEVNCGCLYSGVKKGAEWQKQKDLEDSLKSNMTMPNKFYEKGRLDMRQQMMKDAVEGRVQCGYGDGNKLSIKAMLPQDSDLKYADKVKVLILKTE